MSRAPRAVALHGFPGGLKLAGRKDRSTAQPVRAAPLAPRYVLALAQSSGAPAVPCVAVGDRVRRGQTIATPGDGVSAALHAPTSGVVVALEDRAVAHPSGLAARCIVIDADGRDEAVPPLAPLADDAPAAEVAARLRACGVVGLGGAAFPTDLKLAVPAPPELLVLNGAECEPDIACDDMLMRSRATAVVEGARLLRRASGAARAVIAVENDKPEALAALRAALAPAGDAALAVVAVPARYPEGGERQLIQTLTGREVPRGGLPRDIGVVCVNVGTAAAAADAVVRGLPLVGRLVTVTGDGVAAPCNLEARIGTPIADLVAAAGGYTAQATRLIMGGPMMGFALPDDAIAIVKATNCVLVAGPAEAAARPEPQPCIRCGECAQVCPASLLPQQLYWHARAGELDKARGYALDACIECGCCDLVCPSHIPLAAWFRHAKGELRAKDLERALSDHARERFEARQARLAREERERAERLAAKQAAIAAKATAAPQPSSAGQEGEQG